MKSTHRRKKASKSQQVIFDPAMAQFLIENNVSHIDQLRNRLENLLLQGQKETKEITAVKQNLEKLNEENINLYILNNSKTKSKEAITANLNELVEKENQISSQITGILNQAEWGGFLSRPFLGKPLVPTERRSSLQTSPGQRRGERKF